MTVLGIHATDKKIAELILASSFRPGRKLANYLGEGAYFYLVHGDRGYQNAIESAERVASRHYHNVASLVAEIRIDAALNLQNPALRPLYVTFGDAFGRRVAGLGVQVEPNDNASYYRPVSHLTIEAFWRCIEGVSGRAFDVLSARFALKSRDIDIELPHEICVKRSRAIVSVEMCSPTDRGVSISSDPASWACDHDTLRAAQDAAQVIGAMDDRDLLDLIASIYQGSDGYWLEPRSRFRDFRPLHFLYDARQQERTSELARLVTEIGHAHQRTVHAIDLARVADARTSGAQKLVNEIVEKTAGVIASLTPTDADLATLLVTLAEKRPEVPILALLAPSASSDMLSELKIPIVMRSRHNLCLMKLPPNVALRELVKGFLHDRWSDALAVLDIESKMAARHGNADARHRDARKIVEAYHARARDLF